jgi:hypothetical protein
MVLARACGALAAIAPIASGLLLVGEAGYVTWNVRAGLPFDSAFDPFVVVASAATIAAFVYFRRRVARVPNETRAHVLLLLTIVAIVPQARMWLGGAMHDIMLAFGSHGRFGCSTVDENGELIYWVRDDTLPLFVFGPALLGVIGHWIAQRARARATKVTDPITE